MCLTHFVPFEYSCFNCVCDPITTRAATRESQSVLLYGIKQEFCLGVWHVMHVSDTSFFRSKTALAFELRSAAAEASAVAGGQRQQWAVGAALQGAGCVQHSKRLQYSLQPHGAPYYYSCLRGGALLLPSLPLPLTPIPKPVFKRCCALSVALCGVRSFFCKKKSCNSIGEERECTFRGAKVGALR